jgi:prepilin-type N-terminal cleavage/methylation domain-containing protein
MRTKGFSLIEMLIVVAVVLVLAAIAIPSLVRARMAANESAVVGDVRTVLSAEATFHHLAGAYAPLACLSQPENCAPGAGTMPMVDALIASGVLKDGYNRVFLDDGQPIGAFFSGFCYGGMPTPRGGVRTFSGDETGIIVQSRTGVPCCVGGGNNAALCSPIGK